MNSFSPKKGKVRPPGLSKSLDSYKMTSSSPSLPNISELDLPPDNYTSYERPPSENTMDETSIRAKRMQDIDEKLKQLDDLEFEISMKERDLLNIASEADERFANISIKENSLIEELSKQQDEISNIENSEDVSILSKSILQAPNPDEQALLEIEIEKEQLTIEKENAMTELAKLQSERNGIRLMIEEQRLIYQKLNEGENIKYEYNDYNEVEYINNIQDNSIQDNIYDDEDNKDVNYKYPAGTGLSAVRNLN
jgi:hypothetical protein